MTGAWPPDGAAPKADSWTCRRGFPSEQLSLKDQTVKALRNSRLVVG